MRILLIGATGNISAECAALLHTRGHRITALTRGQGSVPTAYNHIRADRKDVAAMRSALGAEEYDVAIDFIAYDLEDVIAACELLKGRVGQYVFISSATVYSKPPERLPIKETARLGNPVWEYAQKKLQCEQWLLERWQVERFPATIVRPSHTYSRRWVPNVVSSSSYAVVARMEQGKPVFVPDDGSNPWTLTAAEDFVRGLAGLAGNENALGQAVHITSDEVLTWNEIYAKIARAAGVQQPKVLQIPTGFICEQAPNLTGTLKGDKAHPGIFDNSKIKSLVPEFKCEIPFSEGVSRSIHWLREHPDQQNLNAAVLDTFERVVGAWQKARA